MKSKVLFLILITFSVTNLFGQSLDAYKYVIVPNRYDFLNKPDKFQVNSLTKFLFNKEGFKTIFDGQTLPSDLNENPCLGLMVNVIDDSSMLNTKLKIELSDCNEEVVFTSEEGRSKMKDYKKAYHDALRKAFESVKNEDYSFKKNLIKNFNSDKTKQVAKEVQSEINSESVIKNEEEVRVEDKIIKEADEIEKMKENTEEIEDVPFALVEDSSKKILYAQQTTNGFQLVDSTPKIIFKAYKSLKGENVYYLENKAGILYKKDDEWYAEYYKGTVMVIEKLNIKF